MPFAVFRRHQRKLLAVLAILAMFTFVVADSLPRLFGTGGPAGGNPVILELYGRSIYQSKIFEMQNDRNHANVFMSTLFSMMGGSPRPDFFGPLNTRSIVDALILEHKADELGMPVGPQVGRDWLKQLFKNEMTPQLFELIRSQLGQPISGEELLTDIGKQVRLSNVRSLFGRPVVTPFDVFQTYRDQNERVSVKAVAFRVDDYIKDVPDPSSAQVQAYYDKYKDELPEPDHPHPGFKIPRQIEVEILSIDGVAFTKSIQDKLTEPELLTYYENQKSEFKRPSTFPDEIFAGAPELTPPVIQTFAEMRPYLPATLAGERAKAEILARFEKLKNDVMIPFADKYLDAVENDDDAKKDGKAATIAIPKPNDLKQIAANEGFDHEITPLLSQDKANLYGAVSSAEVGSSPLSGGRKFADELFDAKSSLFEPVEFTSFTGRRFLVRKLRDLAPRIPALDEIRGDVVIAWKAEQARPIAEKAAQKFAEGLRKEGGKIAGEVADGKPVISTQSIVKLQPGPAIPSQMFQSGPPVPATIPEMPEAGDALRDAYFGLTAGEVAVASNEPETRYYVLTLNTRSPAPFSALYATNGDYFRYRSEALSDAFKRQDDEWMNALRTEAGVKADWAPLDEAKAS